MLNPASAAADMLVSTVTASAKVAPSHVFHVDCDGGERWHVLCRKICSLDSRLQTSPPPAMPQAVRHGHSACSGAWLPPIAGGFTWGLQNIVEATADHSQALGRISATMASATTPQSSSPHQFPFTVVITHSDVARGIGGIEALAINRELTSCGIAKACAMWQAHPGRHQAVCCRPVVRAQ